MSTPAVDATYTAGRTRPDIVAPLAYTSQSTPAVASAAALLVGVGHASPALSTDPAATSTTNRNGGLTYNAERSEIIKTALMAGATEKRIGDEWHFLKRFHNQECSGGVLSRHYSQNQNRAATHSVTF
jgi:hypothetical protein